MPEVLDRIRPISEAFVAEDVHQPSLDLAVIREPLIDREQPVVFLGNVAHGNSPSEQFALWAAETAEMLELREAVIVLPYIDLPNYRQKEIIQKLRVTHNISDSCRFYFDDEAGKMRKIVLFKGDYKEYLNDVANQGEEISHYLQQRYSGDEPFEVRDIETNEKKMITTNRNTIRMNVGSPIDIGLSVYAFPVLTAEVLRQAKEEHDPTISESDATKVIQMLERQEYPLAFLPYFGPHAWRSKSLASQPTRFHEQDIIYAPPFIATNTDVVQRPTTSEIGMFIVPSGTGRNEHIDGFIQQALQAGIKVYVAAEMADLANDTKGVLPMSPQEAFGNPLINGIVAPRATSGTWWNVQAQDGELFFCFFNTDNLDDWEMVEMRRTLKQYGIGYELNDKPVTKHLLQEERRRQQSKIHDLNEETQRMTGASNGIIFSARITGDYINGER